ncbi:hypothetical protein Q8W71_27820 [Methylobacterium sp. NEAU 140]|uniref:hypothetical protein n=1 Tax=Methylobacterium sp. NEAU 140 TaxID=3064945 RepID=UPI0027336DE2|nr:hypothetical protein [Methylobacterium sp. NEAU 140]MDP4026435.1 hypothetical protein [Methylobacterium sp. NEAU 140]
MTEPDILQWGPYPDRDRGPLVAAFTVPRLHASPDREAVPAAVAAHFAGASLPTPVI